MSLAAIRSALETALAGMTPPLATAYENASFTPSAGVPYQAAYLLLAQPDNSEVGEAFTEQGIFQINLWFPKDAGPADAMARADLIRSTFAKGAAFVSGAATVTITATPEVAPARAEDDRFMVPVKVRFHARIGE